MSKEVVYENPSELKKFENSQLGVTCAIMGERISHEQGVIYARNADEARNGFGICQAAYDALVNPSSALPEAPEEEDDKKSSGKTPPPPVKPFNDEKPEL